jgi:hypothetical protein
MSVYSHQFFDQQSAGSLGSAHVVLKVLFDIAPFKSVVDVGCGVAPWLRAAKDFGVNYAVGLDGDYVDRKRLLVEPVCFRPCDLEAEDLRRVVGDDGPFDLAICMEVAEHLSARRAPAFVTELCSLSDFVLFSAAIPGQGGTNHVNEQWPEYWAAMFANNSFVCFDVLRPSGIQRRRESRLALGLQLRRRCRSCIRECSMVVMRESPRWKPRSIGSGR